MKRLLLYVLPLIMAFSSCNDDLLSTAATLRIEGIVVNNETGEAMEGISVELIGENSSERIVQTDSKGFYSLGVFNTGVYKVRFEKEGFLNIVESINAMNYNMTIAQEQTISLTTAMYPLNETLETIVMSQYSYDAIMLPLANAPYTINLGYFNDPITGTADAEGNINVSGLPSGTYLKLEFDFERDGLVYNSVVQFSLPGGGLGEYIVIRPNVEYVPLFITATNIVDEKGMPVNDFVPNTAIEVSFNQVIDVDNFYMELGYDWDIEMGEIVWSNNNKTVTMNYSGMSYGYNYYLDIQARTVTDPVSTLNQRIDFTTKSSSVK